MFRGGAKAALVTGTTSRTTGGILHYRALHGDLHGPPWRSVEVRLMELRGDLHGGLHGPWSSMSLHGPP